MEAALGGHRLWLQEVAAGRLIVSRSSRVFVLLALWSSTAWAQSPATDDAGTTTVRPVVNDVRAEARWRFDRGLKLYNQNDYRGALAEFLRAYELTHHVQVQFNLALVYAKLEQSAEVVRLLTGLLDAKEPKITPEQQQLAREVVAVHRQRLGLLEVTANVDDAVIQINNVEVAKTPADPIPVGAGSHVVSVLAPDYEPRRFEVVVPSQTTRQLAVELRPLQENLAHLDVSTSAPSVQVFAGDELIGTTPFDASVAFRPGVHQLRFVRPGYVSEERTVVLHPGSSGQLSVKLTLDAAATQQGKLAVTVSQPQALVWVDGEPRLDFSDGLRLPVGKHLLRVERSGYHELQREVVVEPGGSAVFVELFPTADTLAAYVDSAYSQRLWSYVTLGAGVAVSAGAVGFLIWNGARETDAQATFDAELADARDTVSGRCTTPECQEAVRASGDELKRVQGREVWGWVGLGVGVAGMAAGIWMRLGADDPDKFQASSGALVSNLGLEVRPGGAALRGNF